jgi:hypothetical protein
MDLSYLMRRMDEERQRAADAETQAARDAHLAMAEQYRAEVERLRGDNQATELRMAAR